MKSIDTLPRRSRLAVLLFFAAGLAALFILPFHFPVEPAISDSYTFGFNNHAALFIFLVFAIAFAYWSGGLGLVSPEREGRLVGPPMSRRLLWSTLAISAVVTVAFWLAYRGIGAINEGAYVMDRLQHLAAGEAMYRDFEFIYGPILLYIPLMLHRALHLSLLDAYYLSWVFDWILGTYLLWLTVGWASATSSRKNGIYLLAFLGFIFSTVSLGLNYTPLRFVSAPFVAVAVWRMLAARRSVLPGALASIAGAAWILFLSPEQGIAFCVGSVLFFAVFVSRSRPHFGSAIAILVLGEATLVTLLVRSGIVHYMRGMAQGGYNLPLLPSINTLTILLLLIVAACILMNTLRLGRPGGPLEYLILISLFALPAAFGRCDPGHMFMDTLGAFIAAWTVLSCHRSAGKWMVWSYIAGALFLPLALYQANNFFMFPVKAALFSTANPHPGIRHFTQAALKHVLGSRRSQETLAKWHAKYPIPTPSNVPRARTLLAPLGYPSTLLLGDLPPITNGLYRGFGDVMAPYEVKEKLNELRTHPDTLLLFTADASCSDDAGSGPPTPQIIKAQDREMRRELFLNLLPFYVPHVRHREDFLAPVCEYIITHYRPSSYAPPLARAQIWEREVGR